VEADPRPKAAQSWFPGAQCQVRQGFSVRWRIEHDVPQMLCVKPAWIVMLKSVSNREGCGGAGISTWHLQDLKLKGCLEPGEHIECNWRPRDGKVIERSENLEIGDQNLHACVCKEICMNVTCAV
jgi:hypothetical protein